MLKRLRLLLLLPALLFWLGSPACAEEPRQGLAAAADALAKLLPLTVTGNRLHLDWEALARAEDKKVEKDKKPGEDEVVVGPGANGQVQIGGNVVNLGGQVFIRGGMVFGGAGQGGAVNRRFQEVLMRANGGTVNQNSASQSNAQVTLDCSGPLAKGTLSYNDQQHQMQVRLTERGDGKAALVFEDDPETGLLVRLTDPAHERRVVLMQDRDGHVTVTAARGKEDVVFQAADFGTLLRQEPDQVQTLLLRPLDDWGLRLPLQPFLPTVMYAAVNGYGPPAPEVARQVEALVTKLSDDDMQVREEATQELIRLYPRAMFSVAQALANAQDPETQIRLRRVIAAHPLLAQARTFAEEKKLPEDRAYLLEILRTAPSLKAAARARLAQLYGKDYGDDPAAWPKTDKL